MSAAALSIVTAMGSVSGYGSMVSACSLSYSAATNQRRAKVKNRKVLNQPATLDSVTTAVLTQVYLLGMFATRISC